MSCDNRLNKAFEGALMLPLCEHTKYVVFSDCHRGIGNGNDNFLKNECLYLQALKYYFANNYTYIELGDSDELWENRSIEAIKNMHPKAFGLMSEFYCQKRFFSVFGNHDIVKSNPNFSKKYFSTYYCDENDCHRALFPDIVFYPGIILKDRCTNNDIYLTHGHQATLLNSTLWPLSRFLVRYIWKPLEAIGFRDPTSAAKNHHQKQLAEKRLNAWATKYQHRLITGHTHRPMLSASDTSYSNSGSCVSPYGITCIEIIGTDIRLVKWAIDAKSDRTLYIKKQPLT